MCKKAIVYVSNDSKESAELSTFHPISEAKDYFFFKNMVTAALAICYLCVSQVKDHKRLFKGPDYWQPCTPDEAGAKRISFKNVPKVVMPPLLMEDLEMALFQIKDNMDPAYIKKLVKWSQKNSNMPEGY